MQQFGNRGLRFILSLLLVATLGCGSDATAPQPFADVAGDYNLQSVNAAPLPYNFAGASWLFERRLHISGNGEFQVYDVLCTVNGDACPRRESAFSSTMTRAGDGSLVLDFGQGSYVRATPAPSGPLDILVTGLGGGGPSPTVTYRYQRQ